MKSNKRAYICETKQKNNHLKQQNMNYKLNVTETKNKAGKFHYTVTDEKGNIISERKSNREYVACTTNGAFYFGRLDLIGKGDHGRFLKYYNNRAYMTQNQYENVVNECKKFERECETLQEIRNDGIDGLKRLSEIAYK